MRNRSYLLIDADVEEDLFVDLSPKPGAAVHRSLERKQGTMFRGSITVAAVVVVLALAGWLVHTYVLNRYDEQRDLVPGFLSSAMLDNVTVDLEVGLLGCPYTCGMADYHLEVQWCHENESLCKPVSVGCSSSPAGSVAELQPCQDGASCTFLTVQLDQTVNLDLRPQRRQFLRIRLLDTNASTPDVNPPDLLPIFTQALYYRLQVPSWLRPTDKNDVWEILSAPSEQVVISGYQQDTLLMPVWYVDAQSLGYELGVLHAQVNTSGVHGGASTSMELQFVLQVPVFHVNVTRLSLQAPEDLLTQLNSLALETVASMLGVMWVASGLLKSFRAWLIARCCGRRRRGTAPQEAFDNPAFALEPITTGSDA